MKDICVLRYRGDGRPTDRKLRVLLGALVLDGETFDQHQIDDRTILIEIHRAAARSRASQVRVGPAATVAHSGHVQPPRAGDFLDGATLSAEGRSLRLSSSPGGIYAGFFVGGRDRSLFAWPSLSNWERVYHTTGRNLVVVSNSALLSHCLARNTVEPAMNEAWLRDVLIGMGSLREHTQFQGTSVVPSRRSLCVTRSCRVSTEAWPIDIDKNRHEEDSETAVAEVAEALRGAVSPLDDPARCLLRISSGKDSRLIAALLRAGDIVPRTVTYGDEGAPRTRVVKHLARALDLPLEIGRSAQCAPEAILSTVRQQSRNADFGYLAGQQLIKPDDEFDGVDVVVEGHAHHLRGGYAQNRALDHDRARRNFWQHQNAGVAFARPVARMRKKAAIASMFDALARETSPWAALYWAYVDRRVLMTQNYYRRRARSVDQQPPLMDERVLLATSRAHIRDLGSETLFYRVLAHFSPVATQIPVYGKTWRFANQVSDAFTLRRVKSSDPDEGPAHRSLEAAVATFNALREEGLPFAMSDLTPDATFHGDRLSVEALNGNGKSFSDNLDYVWKIVALAVSFGPKAPSPTSVARPSVADMGARIRAV